MAQKNTGSVNSCKLNQVIALHDRDRTPAVVRIVADHRPALSPARAGQSVAKAKAVAGAAIDEDRYVRVAFFGLAGVED